MASNTGPTKNPTFDEWLGANFGGGDKGFSKAEDAIELDYDALWKAGVPQSAIVRGVASELGFDQDVITENVLGSGSQVDPGDFLYVHTNAAKPGTISTFTDNLLRGLTLETPAVASAVAGGKLGFRAAPGPLKGPSTVLGAVGGYLIGSNVGKGTVDVGERLGVFEKDPVMPQNRLAAAFGKSVGEGISFVAPSRFIGKSGEDFAGFLLNERLKNIQGRTGSLLRAPGTALEFVGKAGTEIGRSARETPRRFYAAETSMALGAGAGAVAGEAMTRGDELYVAGGELAGGYAITKTPTAILLKNIPSIFEATKRGISIDKREFKLGSNLRKAIEANGGDADALIETIESQIGRVNPETGEVDFMSMNSLPKILKDTLGIEELPPLTPAQLTGDPALQRFQNYVKSAEKGTSVLDSALANAYQESLETSLRVVKAMEDQNDPVLTAAALQMREELISSVIMQELADNARQAQVAAAKLNVNPEETAVLGRNIKSRLTSVLESINAQESKFWNATPDNVPVENFDDFSRSLEKIRKEYLLESSDFPPKIAAELKRWQAKTGVNFVAEDGPEVISASKAIDNLPPLQVRAYEDLQQRIASPDGRRIFFNDKNFMDDAALDDGPFVRPDADYRILDAIRVRRQKGGLSKELSKQLNDAEKVANARIRLTKAQNTQRASASEEDAVVSDPILTNDIKKLRTVVGDEIRALDMNGRWGEAKPLRQLKKALDDLTGDALGSDNKAYVLARAFTRGKNDALSRTFAGDAFEKDSAGGLRIREELLMDWLTSGSVDQRTLKFRDLEDSGTFVQQQLEELNVPEDSELRIADEEMFGPASQSGLRQDLLRATQFVARKGNILDANGKVIPENVQAFINENPTLLNMYPELRTMLENGTQFENAVKVLTDQKTSASLVERARQNETVARMLTDDNPSLILAEALGDTRMPYSRVMDVVENIKRAANNTDVRKRLEDEGFDPDDAVKGFKSIVLDTMQIDAGKANGTFDFRAAKQFMFGPMKKGVSEAAPSPRGTRDYVAAAKSSSGDPRNKLSLAKVLEKEGIFTSAELDRLEYILNLGDQIQNAPTAEKLKEIVEDKPGMLIRGAVKILGSVGATSLVRRLGMRPNGIVESNIGANIADSYFMDLPESVGSSLLNKAVTDPQFMVKLLKVTKTEEQGKQAVKQLKNYMYNAGMTAISEDETEVSEEVIDRTRRELPRSATEAGEDMQTRIKDFRINQAPSVGPVSMAPQPPRAPTPAPPSAPAPSANVLAQAPSSPATASRMAAAFPGDGIMGLMATRG